MIKKVKKIILENRKISILSLLVLLAILVNALAELIVFGGIAWLIYFCVRNPEKIKARIRKDFNFKNIAFTVIAICLCGVFSFLTVFMGAAGGSGLSNYRGDKDTWEYFLSSSFTTALLFLGMFGFPVLTVTGIVGFWAGIKERLSKILMFSAPISALVFIFVLQLFSGVLLVLSAMGFKIY